MNTKTAIITLVIAVSGTLVTLNFTGENIPTVGEVAKITYAPDGTMRYHVGSFFYSLNNEEEFVNFVNPNTNDDDNTIFARKIVKKLLASSTPEQAISKLEDGLSVSITEEINIE